jgi:hypoxanthine phosphoribosyltransferase
VLLVNDVVDTGVTQQFVTGHLQEEWKPRSLKCAALLDREEHRRVDFGVDYYGFKLARHGFVVGYGLGYEEKFRNLPYLGLLEVPLKK